MIEIKKIAQVTGHKGSIFALLPGDRSHDFLSGGGEGWLVNWDSRDPDPGKLMARVESNVFSLCRHEQWYIAGDMNGGMHWVDPIDNKSKSVQHHRRGIFDIWKYKDGLYALGGDGYLSRRTAPGQNVESVQISHQALRCKVEIDRGIIAVGASDSCIYIIDLEEMSILSRIENAHDPSVFSLAYDPLSQRMFSGGRDAQIRIWNTTGQCIQEIPAHMFTINALIYISKMDLLISGSRDKTIKVWRASDMTLLKVIEGIRDGGHLNSVNCLLWQPDLDYLISGSDDKSIGIWSIKHPSHDSIG